MNNTLKMVREAYTKELREKLEQREQLMDAVLPLLEKYKKNNQAFSIWMLGCQLIGHEEYNRHAEYDLPSAREKAASVTASLTHMINELYYMGYIDREESRNYGPSVPYMYRFV